MMSCRQLLSEFTRSYPDGLLEKSRSLLGHFLNAPLHFTKNAPISQRGKPLWTLLAVGTTATAKAVYERKTKICFRYHSLQIRLSYGICRITYR
ncbi:MAG: hypothetical protein KIB51_04730 [Dysgonomonas mossii]|nr:hypothetical protein [Dysgonomonas mossii]